MTAPRTRHGDASELSPANAKLFGVLGLAFQRARGGRIATLASIVVLSSLAAPDPASAELRLWKTGEPGEDEHKYFDFTGFLQPGFIWRQDDPFAGRTEDTFDLQRARMGFRARLLSWLEMRAVVDLARTPRMADAYVEMPFFDEFELRAGQFLVPFLRAYQFNELDLAFLDRPVYTPISPDRSFLRYLSPRDIGVMAHGMIGDPDPASQLPVLQYRVGAFQGAGPNVRQNNDGAFLLAARLQLHLFGAPQGRHSESDLARNETPRLGVAAAVYSNCDTNNNWNRGVTGDAELRWNGLYSSAAVVWFRNGDARGRDVGEFFNYDSACVGNPEGNPLEFVSSGAHWQLQYALPKVIFPPPAQELEVLARFGWVSPLQPYDEDNRFRAGENHPRYQAPVEIDNKDNAPTQWRLTVGVNWFPTGKQALKLQLNYQHKREAEDLRTTEGVVVGVDNDILWLQLTAGL